ncbi:hypothetical protein [Agarilytica rhodophyticola]|uniref:hypothetical protein n=1 Tax=Agarilytica rhodophyticola TaxID=1737490 RepID=UPI000B342626|nr:hypothetical protein [Agarilytica rhodophyticola]
MLNLDYEVKQLEEKIGIDIPLHSGAAEITTTSGKTIWFERYDEVETLALAIELAVDPTLRDNPSKLAACLSLNTNAPLMQGTYLGYIEESNDLALIKSLSYSAATAIEIEKGLEQLIKLGDEILEKI